MAGQVKASRSGARIVELFVPFKHGDDWVRDVALGPITFGHVQDYGKAEFASWFEFMVSLASVNGTPATSELMRALRYPDVDRVITCFVEILPSEIRQSVSAGVWPTREPVLPEGSDKSTPPVAVDALEEALKGEFESTHPDVAAQTAAELAVPAPEEPPQEEPDPRITPNEFPKAGVPVPTPEYIDDLNVDD